jgi:hypothetical protein
MCRIQSSSATTTATAVKITVGGSEDNSNSNKNVLFRNAKKLKKYRNRIYFFKTRVYIS